MAGPHRYGKISIIFLVILLQLAGVRAAVDYCSSYNTGSTAKYQSLYQTSGFCSDKCRGDYSWAIISGYDCWCSNSAPPSANDMSECSEPCPGSAVEERCGNSKSGRYGYIYLGTGQRPLVPQTSSSSSTSSQTAIQTQKSTSTLEEGAKGESTLAAHGTTGKTTSTVDAHKTSVTTTASLPPRKSEEKTTSSIIEENKTTATTTKPVIPSSPSITLSSKSQTQTTTAEVSTSSTTTTSQTSTNTSPTTAEVSTPSTTTTSQISTNTSPTTAPPLVLISTVTVVATPTPSASPTSESSASQSPVTQYHLVTSVLVSMQTVTVLSTPQNGSIEVVSSIATMTTTAVYNASIATMTTTAMFNASIATSSETPPSLSIASTDNLKHRHRTTFWDSPGKVAATFIPVGFLLIILIVLFIWMCLHRRRDYNYQDADLLRFHSDVSSSGTVMQNHQKSAFVYADEKGIHTSPGPRSNRNARNSSALLSTSTVAANSSSGTDSLPVSRDSKTEALLVDQRLDPSHVMSQWGESGSRVSLADDVDYSRKVLRVINE